MVAVALHVKRMILWLFLTRPPSHLPPFYLHPSPPFILLSLLFFFGVPPLCVSVGSAWGFSPRIPLCCLLMGSTFQRLCLGWCELFKHTHRLRQAHNFICLLNLWPRQIKIKPTVCVKAERGGGRASFSQTRPETRRRCLPRLTME